MQTIKGSEFNEKYSNTLFIKVLTPQFEGSDTFNDYDGFVYRIGTNVLYGVTDDDYLFHFNSFVDDGLIEYCSDEDEEDSYDME